MTSARGTEFSLFPEASGTTHRRGEVLRVLEGGSPRRWNWWQEEGNGPGEGGQRVISLGVPGEVRGWWGQDCLKIRIRAGNGARGSSCGLLATLFDHCVTIAGPRARPENGVAGLFLTMFWAQGSLISHIFQGGPIGEERFVHLFRFGVVYQDGFSLKKVSGS